MPVTKDLCSHCHKGYMTSELRDSNYLFCNNCFKTKEVSPAKKENEWEDTLEEYLINLFHDRDDY